MLKNPRVTIRRPSMLLGFSAVVKAFEPAGYGDVERWQNIPAS